jgi:hypothetical protein
VIVHGKTFFMFLIKALFFRMPPTGYFCVDFRGADFVQARVVNVQVYFGKNAWFFWGVTEVGPAGKDGCLLGYRLFFHIVSEKRTG